MNYRHLLFAMAFGIIGTGCTNIEHSRNLANPKVPGTTLAQQVCALCHGVDGHSTSPNFPNLAGQQPTYFIAQMQEFRNHSRMDPAGFEYMWVERRSQTDEQITTLADYYAAQTPASPGPAGTAATLARGKAVFENGVPEKNVTACFACHGAQAQGNGQFPRLAHQHADYIVKQLTVFQRTDERPEGALMKTVAHELTADDMANVAAYLQSLPSP